jgi:beta-1,4-mannosyltransferase
VIVASFPPALPENPYLRLLRGALARQGVETVEGRPRLAWAMRARSTIDVAHLHWLEIYVHARGGMAARVPRLAVVVYLARAVRFLLLLTVLRLSGVRIVWTVHNLRPHEQAFPTLDRLLMRAVALLSHALVVHSRYAHARLVGEYRWLARPVWIAPHGHYLDDYPPAATARDALRAELGIPGDAFVFLLFGQLRRYKRVDRAILAVRGLDRSDVHLLIAGAPLDDEVRDEVVGAADGDPRIHLRLEFVADAEVAGLHETADAAVVAYPEVFSSGALLLALSLGLPVVAPRGSAAAEIAEPPAVVTFEPGGMVDALLAMRGVGREEGRRAALAAAGRQPWDVTAARVRDAYAGVRPDAGSRGG